MWIDHFRTGNDQLTLYLEQGFIVVHPYIVAELALGSIKDRKNVLENLDRLAHVAPAQDHEVRTLIDQRKLFSRGIGYVDAHLLAATAIDGRTSLWTLDQRLKNVATDLDLAVKDTV